MRSFHFDIGNSTAGQIGFCARVLASSEAEAVGILKTALLNIECEHKVVDDVEDAHDPDGPFPASLEYIRVYFNADNITEADIDDSEEREDDGGDDLCDTCMRSGVHVARTDEDGKTVCVDCDENE